MTYTLRGGDGVKGQICYILTPGSYKSLTALSGHTDSHTGYIYLGVGGGGGGLCYYIDIEHSTNLQVSMPTTDMYTGF
jgi:hypothetical protein